MLELTIERSLIPGILCAPYKYRSPLIKLLSMPERRVAQANEKPERQEIELAPERIQQLIDGDRVSFINRAKDLQDAATMVLKAIDARDKKGLLDALTVLDKACENCHLQYW